MQNSFLGGGRFGKLWALALNFLIAAQPLFSQASLPSSGSPISVNVDLVVLPVTVQNKKGEFVSGLRKENFRVYEDGVPQAIQVFQKEDVPVAIGLIVDNSGSMVRKRQDVTAAALAFAHSSNPQDEMFVVNFNEHVSLGLPPRELFSASPAELTEALNGIPARGMTALYDAIEAGLAHLRKATLRRKVLIVVSDGGDNASHYRLNQVLQDVERSDVTIYTIGLYDEYDEDRNPGVLKKLSRATGGKTFLPAETRDVVAICRRIAQEIRTQYTIGYIPSDQKLDNTYRTIKVTATSRHGRKLLVRTRPGYIASPQRLTQPEASQERHP